MAGARITFTLDDKGFNTGVQRLGGVLRTGVIRAIGVALVETTQHRFETATDPFGQKWQKLLPAYAAIKKGPGILRAGRYLQRSITFEAAGNKVTVGSGMKYAAVHQFGAVIKPVRAKALAFHLGGLYGPHKAKDKPGTFLVLAKSVRIPQRPYLGFGPEDQRAVMDQINIAVAKSFGS